MVCSDKLPLVDFILHPAEWKVNREERDFTISLQRWQNVAVSFTKSSENVRELRLTVCGKCDMFSMLIISMLNISKERNDPMQEMKPLGPLLGYCAHLFRERLDARLAQDDVTPAQVRVIHYLYHQGGSAPQCEVTAHLKVRPSTANGILDRMEEKGLLRRTVSETDARRRRIELTEKGIDKQETLRHKFEEAETLMTGGLSGEELEQLHQLLFCIMTNLEEDRKQC